LLQEGARRNLVSWEWPAVLLSYRCSHSLRLFFFRWSPKNSGSLTDTLSGRPSISDEVVRWMEGTTPGRTCMLCSVDWLSRMTRIHRPMSDDHCLHYSYLLLLSKTRTRPRNTGANSSSRRKMAMHRCEPLQLCDCVRGRRRERARTTLSRRRRACERVATTMPTDRAILLIDNKRSDRVPQRIFRCQCLRFTFFLITQNNIDAQNTRTHTLKNTCTQILPYEHL
jgi:hypothetical protein